MCLTANNEDTAAKTKTEATTSVSILLEKAGLNHSNTYQVPDVKALSVFTKALRSASTESKTGFFSERITVLIKDYQP